MFLIKKAVFKPIDCKDSANRTQYQKKSKDFLLALLRCRLSYQKIVQTLSCKRSPGSCKKNGFFSWDFCENICKFAKTMTNPLI